MRNEHSKVRPHPGWNHLNPSWTSRGQIRKLEEDFRIKYTGDGWYNKENDWMLIQAGEDYFSIWFWKGVDPRTHLLQIAGAEVRVFAGAPV